MVELAAQHHPPRRATLLTSAAGVALSIALTAPQASALPVVQSGTLSGVSVPTPPAGATTETATVSQSRAYAQWSSFNIAPGETFQVLGQTGKNWILVNKVTGGSGPANISGNLSANGQVWIIDPNGITVNAGAKINVGGLLLSTAAWGSTDTTSFLNGATSGTLTGATGPIVMNGTINASGGLVALIAPSVSVGGTVTGAANTQFVAVAAKDVSLSFGDDGTYLTLSGLTIQKGAAGGGVQIGSTAAITADRIIVAAAGADTAANIVVGGTLTATQARGDGTDIVLLAADATGSDASATPRSILSGGAVQPWSAGSVHGALSVQPGAVLAADTGGVVLEAGAGLTQNGAVTAMGGTAVTSSTGDVTLGGGISAGGALTVGAGGVINLGANLSAGGALALNAPVVLQSDATLTSATVSFSSTVDGGHNLAVSGNGVFGGAVGSGTQLASLSVSGTSALNGGLVMTTGTQTYTGAATLGADTTLTGSTVSFGSTLDGAHGLAISGNGVFGGAVGSGTKLTVLSVSGTSALDGGVVKTTGVQTYTGAATLGADTTLTGSTVSFGSTLDGAYNFAISGNGVFGGTVGAGTRLTSLSVSGTSALDGGVVKTTGAQTYTGVATLGADTTLTGSILSFGSTLDGAYNLAISGNGVFGAGVGSGTALASVSVSGTSALNGGPVKTTGTQTYTGAATLGADTALTGPTVIFGSTLDGAHSLAISGNGVFGGAVGSGLRLTSLTVNGTSALDGGVVKTSGTQTYTGATTLGADATLTGSTVSFGSTLDGAYNLAISGNGVLGGAVGSGLRLTSLSVSGTTALDGGVVKTTGTQTYTGAATLGADTALTGSTVSFGSTLDGGHSLAISGNGVFGGAVGSGTALASVSVSGTSALNGGAVKTTGVQTYTGAATLGADTSLTGPTVIFGSTLEGAHVLAISGNGVFGGAAGSGTQLTSLSVSGTSALDGGPVKTTGAQSYTGAVTLGGDAALTGSTVSFGSTLDGAHDLAINGNVVFGGAVGAGTQLTSLSVSGTSALNGGVVTTTGTQSYTGAATLGADTTLTGSTVTFASTLDGAHNLAVSGNAVFGGAVGAGTQLTSLSVSGTSALDGGVVKTTGAQTYTGAATLGADASLTGSDVTFGSTLDGGFGLTLTATGTAQFTGPIGGSTALSSLDVRANRIALGAAASTTGRVVLNSVSGLDIDHPISSLGGGVTLKTKGGGDLVLAADVDAGSSTVTLSSAGAIRQTAGLLSGGTLTGSAATSILLPGGDVASVVNLTANSGLLLIDDRGVTVSGATGGTSVALTTRAGDLTLVGDVGAGAVTLTAAGAISQTGGAVTAGTLTGSAGTRADLNDANAVTTLASFTAPGGFSFRNGAGFTATDIRGGPSVSLMADTGDLTLAGDVSGTTVALTARTGAITQTGGVVTAVTLSGYAGTRATLGRANAVGTLSDFTASSGLTFFDASGFTVSGVQGGSSATLTANSGDLTLAGDLGGTTVVLTAPGAITQTGGAVTATTLTGSAGTTATLNDANAVSRLSNFTAPGGLAFTNATGFTATGVSGGPSLSLRTNSGDLTIAGDLTGTTVALNAAGAIVQTGGVVTATTLTGSAGTSATLNDANAVSVLSDFTAGGGLAFTDAGSLSARGVNGGSSTALTTAGDLTLSGDLGGGAVALNAAGALVQTSGVLTAGTLTGSSIGKTTLTDANLIGTLGVFTTYGAGADFSLVNAQTLTVTGPLTVGATTPGAAAEGNLSLTITAGQLNLDGDLIARADTLETGGRVALTSADGIASGDPPGIQALDISISNHAGSVSLGDLTATRDIAISTSTGSLTIDAASAGGNLVLRAPGDITVVNGLSAMGTAADSGAAAALFASNPTTLGGVAFSLAGATVDVKAGGSISVGGATFAATDARFQANGAVSLGPVAAGQDAVAEGASVAAGALSAANGGVALQASGGVQIASASAGDAIVISSGGTTSVSGALTAVGAGTGDGRPRAGDTLAAAVLGVEPGQITGDVVIAAGDVQLGPISAANGDVLMFAAGGAAGVTRLGGTASSDAQGGFHLDMDEIAGITAHSLNVFAGLGLAGSGDVSIGALNLPQSLATLRVYTGGASRVDVFGPVTGAPGSSLIIGDTQLRGELNRPPAALLALSQGWTPSVIRVEGTIGGLGAGQAFNQVSLSAQNIYIAPVEAGLGFETAVKTTRPESLAVYAGSMTWQVAAANLQLSASGPGVIYERNLARNPSDLEAGVGLSVGRITIATLKPSDAPPSQIALFGTLDPHGTVLNGLSAALSLTFSSQAGSGAPVRFRPPPSIIDLYRFSTCAFGGGACFINVPPYAVPTVPVPDQIGDLSDPYAPTDEEPVTSSGGEITWPSVSGGDHRP